MARMLAMRAGGKYSLWYCCRRHTGAPKAQLRQSARHAETRKWRAEAAADMGYSSPRSSRS